MRRIFDLYTAGTASAAAIADRLNLEGLPMPTARAGKGWIANSITDMLRNVAYTGRTYAGSRKRREGELIPATWPAIVADATFDRAGEILTDRTPKGGSRAGAGKPYAFGGLLVCDVCGGKLRVVTAGPRVYYRCRRDVSQPCPVPGIAEPSLIRWAGELFEAIESLQPADFGAAVTAAMGRRRSAEGAIASISLALENTAKQHRWGHMTDAAYLAEVARLEALRAELEGQAAAGPVALQLDGVGALWEAGSAEERRALLGVLFDRLYVKDGRVSVYVGRREHRAQVEELVGLACRRAEREGFEPPIALRL